MTDFNQRVADAIREGMRVGGGDLAVALAAGLEEAIAALHDIEAEMRRDVECSVAEATNVRNDGYGAPGCDCPLPEKASETCPVHGTHKSDYGASLADHRFDAERPDMPCQMILRGIDPANVCGRPRSEHASGVWDTDNTPKSYYGATPDTCPNRVYPEHGAESVCVMCGYRNADFDASAPEANR